LDELVRGTRGFRIADLRLRIGTRLKPWRRQDL
jgi:hypothetical protein